MNEASIKAFLQRADQDPLLKNQVTEILAGPAEQIPERLAQLSATSEAPFTAEEFRASFQDKNLSESELTNIAGGGPGMLFDRDYDHNDKRGFWERVVDRFK